MPSPFLLDVGSSIGPVSPTNKSSGKFLTADRQTEGSSSIFSNHLIDFTRKKQTPAPSKADDVADRAAHAKKPSDKSGNADDDSKADAKHAVRSEKTSQSDKSKTAKKAARKHHVDESGATDDDDEKPADATVKAGNVVNEDHEESADDDSVDSGKNSAKAETADESLESCTDLDAAAALAAGTVAQTKRPVNGDPQQVAKDANAKKAIDPTKAAGAAQTSAAGAARPVRNEEGAQEKSKVGEASANPAVAAQLKSQNEASSNDEADSDADIATSTAAKGDDGAGKTEQTKPIGQAFLGDAPAIKPVNDGDSRSANGKSGDGSNGQSQSSQGSIDLSDFLDQLVSQDDGKFADFDTLLDNGSAAFKKSVADVANELMSAAAAASGGVAGKIDGSHSKMVDMPVQIAQANTPDQQFAVDNHAKIISSVHTAALSDGGSMTIRLDPPELGDMQLSVTMRDGVMDATFETTNERATRMLSHSLSDLKSSLEAAGVTVDKLHVQQAPKNEASSDKRNGDPQQQQSSSQDSSPRREQERREMLQRMWRRLANGSDPLDTVA